MNINLSSTGNITELVSVFKKRLPGAVVLLREFVECESPTYAKEAVDAMGELVAREVKKLGAEIERIPQEKVGDHLVLRWGSGSGGVLLLAHLDTVFPLGTLAAFPWSEEGEYLRGPGVADMKGGIVVILMAMRFITETMDHIPRVTLFCNSEEETGSASARSLVEKLAREHEQALCFETGTRKGAVKTARKGTGLLALETFGKASHAGSSLAQGVNAIVEMQTQLLHVLSFVDAAKGTTLSPGRIEGGVARNVVADHCRAEIDVRVATLEEQERITLQVSKLRPVLAGAKVSASVKWHRPPMERTAAVAQLYEKMRIVAQGLALELPEVRSGGASDANFVAALGLPVLDGLGPIGHEGHSSGEYILKDSLAERAALLAAFLKAVPLRLAQTP